MSNAMSDTVCTMASLLSRLTHSTKLFLLLVDLLSESINGGLGRTLSLLGQTQLLSLTGQDHLIRGLQLTHQ